MLLSTRICCRIFHRFLCKGYARRIRLSFVGMSKEKKEEETRGRASEQKNERIKLLVWEHCSVATTTRHGRMSSRVVRADTIELRLKLFTSCISGIKAKSASPLMITRFMRNRHWLNKRNVCSCRKFRVCQNSRYCVYFYRIFPDPITRKYSFAPFFFPPKSVLLFAFISPIFQVRSTFTSIRYIIVVIVSKKLGALRKGNVERLSGLRASSLGEITR